MTDSLRLQSFLPYRCANLAERISVALSRIYVDQFGVSIAEWRILATLAEHDRLRAQQIGALTNMDKVRVSRAVSSLQDKKLLLKTPCERDSRAADLRLSPGGKRLYKRIVPRALAWEESLVEPLSDTEMATLLHLLDKLDARVDQLEQSAGPNR
jgi:DNA-binding MarR family transcriptional regulator